MKHTLKFQGVPAVVETGTIEIEVDFPIYRDHLLDDSDCVSRISMEPDGRLKEITVTQRYSDNGPWEITVDPNFTVDGRCWEWCLGQGVNKGSPSSFNHLYRSALALLTPLPE